MAAPSFRGRPLLIPMLAVLSLGCLLLALARWSEGPAAEPGKKPPPPDEQYEDNTKVKPAGVPNDPGKAAPDDPLAVPAQIDLAQEARDTTHPGLRALFDNLRVPHERAWWPKNQPVGHDIVPLDIYVGEQTGKLNVYHLQPFEKDWTTNPEKAVKYGAHYLTRIEAYEEIAQQEVAQFLARHYDSDPASATYLKRADILLKADMALTAVLRWHEATRTRSDEWLPVLKGLNARLLDIKLQRLDLIAAPKLWEARALAARQLAERFSRPEERKQIADHLIDLLQKALVGAKDEQIQAVREQLRGLEDLFPGGDLTKPVQDHYRKQAEALVVDARKQFAAGNSDEGARLLKEAEKLCPSVAGLNELRLPLGREQVLRVGVRCLPTNFLPGGPHIDSERLAIELLFESLVRPDYDPQLRQRFTPELALGRPHLVPLGREFQLPGQAYWSSGKPLTTDDVVHTVGLLRNPQWPGYSRAWAALVEPAHKGSYERVTLTLTRGYLDPLALMTFKLLPQGLTPTNASDFAEHPVGSGPYQYVSQPKLGPGQQPYVKFVANPNYCRRVGKDPLPLPWIREIHFIQSKDPAQDLLERKIDLCLDMPTAGLGKLKDANYQIQKLSAQPNRRVWFLAVDHRRANQYHNLLGNRDLRCALAHAINRDEILTHCFRNDQEQAAHKVLRGLYPANSWAYQGEWRVLKGDPLYAPLHARSHLEAVRQAGLKDAILLSLKFANEDPRVAKAMQELQAQLQKAGIGVKLDGEDADKLRKDVEVDHDYDLAYYYYDFPDDTYWLWPLFDSDLRASDKNGSNFLGYQEDLALEGEILRQLEYRDFRKVQEYAGSINLLLEEKMPVIPLWQIDQHVVAHPRLKMPHAVDPLVGFTDVDQWELVGGRK